MSDETVMQRIIREDHGGGALVARLVKWNDRLGIDVRTGANVSEDGEFLWTKKGIRVGLKEAEDLIKFLEDACDQMSKLL